MATQSTTESHPKRRRFLIFTDDEGIINQIQTSSNSANYQTTVIEYNETEHNIIQTAISTRSLDTNFAREASEPQQLKKKPEKRSLTCSICGDVAHGYNFGAITCESCKAFFRRNGLKKPEALQCRLNGDCCIVFTSRPHCSACRLAKCINAGMQLGRTSAKIQLAEDLYRIDDTTKVSSHSSDIFPALPSPEVINLGLTTDFTSLSGATITTRTSGISLNTEELQCINRIQTFYQGFGELGTPASFPSSRSMNAPDMFQFVNNRSQNILELISVFKQVPEFAQLNVDDRVTLIKFNIMPISLLSTCLSPIAQQLNAVEVQQSRSCEGMVMFKIHSMETMEKLRKIMMFFTKVAQSDERIIQLFFIILILMKGFSTIQNDREPVLNDGIAVYRAQCYYADLLWKCLETSHDSLQALRVFTGLTTRLLSLQSFNRQMFTELQQQFSPTDVEQLLPIMKSVLMLS